MRLDDGGTALGSERGDGNRGTSTDVGPVDLATIKGFDTTHHNMLAVCGDVRPHPVQLTDVAESGGVHVLGDDRCSFRHREQRNHLRVHVRVETGEKAELQS